MTKNQKILVSFAIIISLVFCGELFVNGYEHFRVTSNQREEHAYVASFSLRYIRRGVEYIILNIIYVIWLLQNRQESRFYSFIDILRVTSIFLLIAFVAYPNTSDIYTYLHSGLMGLNKINPFINEAGKFNSELSPFLIWHQSSTYGPVSQLFFIIAAYFTSISIILGVYVFKVFCLLSHTINAYLIWRQLRLSNHQSKITRAYLVNPILLFEHVGQAHVDVFICTALIVLIGCLKHRQYIAGILAIWIGFLAKTLPIIWLPLVSVFLVRQQRWKSLLIATFLSLAIFTALCFTVLPTYEAWTSILNPGVIWQTAGSLHNVLDVALNKIEHLLPNPVEHPHRIKHISLFGFKMITYLGFALYYGWTLFKLYFRRGYSEANLILDIGWTTLVLFLFATPWYQPWYASVLLPITALNANSWFFVFTSLTFCISSTSYYLLAYKSEPTVLVMVSMITVVPTIVVLLFRQKLLRARPPVNRQAN